MFEGFKTFFRKSGSPPRVAMGTEQVNRVSTLIADAVERQLTMAQRGGPSERSERTRSTVLGYITAAGEAMTNDPGGPQAMLVTVLGSQKVLKNTFNAEHMLTVFEDLPSGGDAHYAAGATEGYEDTRRLKQRRPLIGLMEALQ